MARYALIVAYLVAFATCVALANHKNLTFPFKYYSKLEWGGRPATAACPLVHPVPYVIIHHSYEPGACYTEEQCKATMRTMQKYHMITKGWPDISYNFAVGGDGAVYEGRGWHTVGAHTIGYDTDSIGIVLIGDWVSERPPQRQLQATKDLIAAGVGLGLIARDYHLLGHRQIIATECPGEALYRELTCWNRFYRN